MSAMAMSLIDGSAGWLTISIQSKKVIRRIVNSLKAAKPQITLQAVGRLDIRLDERPSKNQVVEAEDLENIIFKSPAHFNIISFSSVSIRGDFSLITKAFRARTLERLKTLFLYNLVLPEADMILFGKAIAKLPSLESLQTYRIQRPWKYFQPVVRKARPSVRVIEFEKFDLPPGGNDTESAALCSFLKTCGVMENLQKLDFDCPQGLKDTEVIEGVAQMIRDLSSLQFLTFRADDAVRLGGIADALKKNRSWSPPTINIDDLLAFRSLLKKDCLTLTELAISALYIRIDGGGAHGNLVQDAAIQEHHKVIEYYLALNQKGRAKLLTRGQ